jgi:hypothetical protein
MNAERILIIEPFPPLADSLRSPLSRPASPSEVCALERCGLTAFVTAGRLRSDIAIVEYELPDADGPDLPLA